MNDQDEEFYIELTDSGPTCCYVGRNPGERCFGPVVAQGQNRPTCVGHASTAFNGRYYSEAALRKIRKTGGRLYPLFQPLAQPHRPLVDAKLEALWEGWTEDWTSALDAVNKALARTKLPRDPKDHPPPSSRAFSEPKNAEVVVVCQSDRLELTNGEEEK